MKNSTKQIHSLSTPRGGRKRDILETMHVIISSVYLAKWVAGNKIKKARPWANGKEREMGKEDIL